MNGFNIRSAADWRAAGYVLWPLVATLLVGKGVVSESQAALWGGLVAAVLGPVIAFVYARGADEFRAGFHALLGAVQALVIGYGIVSAAEIGLWLPLVTAGVGFLTGGVAAANTDTTPAGPLPPSAAGGF